MKRTTLGWIAAFVLAVGGSALAWVFFFAGGSGEPSTDLTTPPIATTTTSPDAVTDNSEEPSASTSEPTSGEQSTFVIDATQSVASFQLDEVLRGEATSVLGSTDQVAGQMLVIGDDLGSSVISDIVINARTFTTDSEQRNRAIRGPVVLDSASDQNELIVFTPRSIDGLEGAQAGVGQTYEFTVDGELTIKGTTAPAIFDVTVEMVDDGSISGLATTQVLRSDFGIGIPSVPFVADVSDEVELTLEFVALAS